MVKLLMVSMLLLGGCSGLQHLTPERALGGGVATGVVAGKVAEKARTALTAQYKLQFQPIEICGLDMPHKVTCYLVPCKASDQLCSYTQDKDKWIQSNPKVMTLRSSLLVPAKHFCNKNPEACDRYVGYYSGYKIVIKEDK